MFFDTLLLDVDGWINQHPGGAFMIKEMIGEDVGKFLNGSSSLPEFNPNYHPSKAFSFARSMAIGKVGFETQILKNKGNGDQERME